MIHKHFVIFAVKDNVHIISIKTELGFLNIGDFIMQFLCMYKKKKTQQHIDKVKVSHYDAALLLYIWSTL